MREKFPKENQPPPRGYSGPRPVRFAVKRHKKNRNAIASQMFNHAKAREQAGSSST